MFIFAAKTYIMTEFKNYLKKQVIMTLLELSLLINASTRTVQRKLKQLDTIRSYDHNGRFFALKEVAQFNAYGIWKYKEIHFSKYGNLKNTLIQVIINSDAGINAVDIRNILGMEPRSFLFHYKDIKQVKRKKIDGCYVYFSSNSTRYKFQLTNRKKLIREPLSYSLKDATGIMVLIETIKHPDYTAERLSKHLRKQGIKIKPEAIINFYKFHDIKKKRI